MENPGLRVSVYCGTCHLHPHSTGQSKANDHHYLHQGEGAQSHTCPRGELAEWVDGTKELGGEQGPRVTECLLGTTSTPSNPQAQELNIALRFAHFTDKNTKNC